MQRLSSRKWPNRAVLSTLAILVAAQMGNNRLALAQGSTTPPETKEYAEFAGRTEAAQDVRIVPRMAGFLTIIHFQEGDRVEKGQLLFELDARPLQIAVEQARGEFAQAKAALVAAEADLKRKQQLAATAAVSRADVDMAVANLTNATAKTKVAETMVATAELNLDATRIVAPITGRAGRVSLSTGNWAEPGTALTTVVSEEPIHVCFDVPEKLYLQLSRHGRRDGGKNLIKELQIPVQVALTDERGFPRAGQLDFVDNRADPNTNTIRFRAVLSNADRAMIPGLSVRVRMQVGQATSSGSETTTPGGAR